MKAKSTFTETVIANSLVAIFERLGDVEKVLVALVNKFDTTNEAEKTKDEALLHKLGRLTIKRHAVLTATLGGMTYKQISNHMGCDVSTVKIHLRAAMNMLGIESRDKLMAVYPDLLHHIDDGDYTARYGISKRWWLEEKPSVMAVLLRKKPAVNQYTKARSAKSAPKQP